MPTFVTSWLAQNEERKKFLIEAGLFNASSPIIKIRQALLDNKESEKIEYHPHIRPIHLFGLIGKDLMPSKEFRIDIHYYKN
ncbi:MAG: hypothetical protein IPL33_05170 [Sphingobacteriales bacterium]|nr:hypothetical protein [Sphingobacteriales bacterium]